VTVKNYIKWPTQEAIENALEDTTGIDGGVALFFVAISLVMLLLFGFWYFFLGGKEKI
jgi:hypothetical protein